MRAYDEIVDFIASSAGAEKLAQFRPSKKAVERVTQLVERKKDGTLKASEDEELRQFLLLEHAMRMAKARARKLTPAG